MIRLDTTTRKLQAVLAGAITTNQLPCTVSYSDKTSTDYVGATQLTNTNSTTAVDICNAPAASTIRDIDYLSIRNRDTATATVTVMIDDSATDYEIVKATLAVGDQLIYTHGTGWQVIASDGTVKTGAGLADGDKGDITVASGTWTIDPAAVTLAKMANLAQDQFIGRTTASTGVPETATITAAARTVLDDTSTGAMLTTLGAASLGANTFTGLQTWSAGANIASAATLDLTAATGNIVRITGTTMTTNVTINAGQMVWLTSVSAWPMTHHATNLPLPGGIDWPGEAGAKFCFFKDNNGDKHILIFKKDGTPVVATPSSFPSGTKMLFQQTSAPTGWTKDVTHNDKALRVVSGAASSGGTSAFSTVFGKTATDAHTLTSAQIPAHTHPQAADTTRNSVVSGAVNIGDSVGGLTGGTTQSNTGGGGSHSHGMDIRVQYVDLIIATKD